MSPIRIVADDLGWSEAVDEGIAEAAEAGVLDAVSAMATGPTLASGLARLRERAPAVPVGLHLDLTDFEPVAPRASIPSLIDARGGFARRSRALLGALLLGHVAREDLARELAAQADRLEAAGVRIAHLDGHRHVHLFPRVASEAARLVSRRSIPYVRSVPWRSLIGVRARAAPERGALALLSVRLVRHLSGSHARHADALVGLAQGFAPDLEALIQAVRQAPTPGLVEIVTHPGRSEAESVGRRDPSPRLRDLEMLRSPRLRAALAEARAADPAAPDPRAPDPRAPDPRATG